MKKLLCFLLCLTLIFSSVSLCFGVDWSSTDQQNLSNAASRLYYSGQSAAYYLYNIATSTNNIYNKCVDIYNALFYGNHNISYWVAAINSFMNPILSAIQQTPLDLEKIYMSMNYTTDTDNDGNLEYHPYMFDINKNNERLVKALTNSSWTVEEFAPRWNAHNYFVGSDGTYSIPSITENGVWDPINVNWKQGSPLGNIALLLRYLNLATIRQNMTDINMGYKGYNSQQSALSWTDIEQSISFTPQSETDGIYKWLSYIQTPVARLSYVLASDERIAAQEAAAANEQAVVDNFIDSSGDGSTTPSNIGSVSDLSSGYKQNFGSNASVTGIFNIFDSNNMGWFSQETKNQLDTTTPTRLTKGQESETPLLDKQIDEIYDALGVKKP